MKSTLFSKPFLSPLVAIAFLVISVTGVMLFFHMKNGPIMVLHEWFGWAFVVAGAVHVLLNWRPLLSYFKLRRSWVSLVFSLVCVGLLFAMGLNHENHEGGPRRHGASSTDSPSLETSKDLGNP